MIGVPCRTGRLQFRQDLALAVRADQAPHRRARLARQSFDHVCDLGWMQGAQEFAYGRSVFGGQCLIQPVNRFLRVVLACQIIHGGAQVFKPSVSIAERNG